MNDAATLDAVAETAGAAPARRTAPGFLRTCPECSTTFQAAQRGQIFCSRVHKRAYNNRWLKRGAVLAPIFAAARVTRNGTRGDKATGAQASHDANLLAQLWQDEDAAAGRMPGVEYMALRYRLGLVDVLR